MLETTLGESEMWQRATIVRYAIASRQPWRTLYLEQVRRPGFPKTMTTERSGGFLEFVGVEVRYRITVAEKQ